MNKIIIASNFILLLVVMIMMVSRRGLSKTERAILKTEIKNEIQSESGGRHLLKGDGTSFYNELVIMGDTEYYIHHSTLKCPKINGGVGLNVHKLFFYNNLYCPLCMDNELIDVFYKKNFPNGKDSNGYKIQYSVNL